MASKLMLDVKLPAVLFWAAAAGGRLDVWKMKAPGPKENMADVPGTTSTWRGMEEMDEKLISVLI